MALKRFTHGPPILVDMGNAILDTIQPYLLMPGAATPLTRMPGGTLLPVGQGAASSPVTHAFQVFDASLTGSPMIRVQAGSLTDLTNSSAVWATAGPNIIYLNDYLAGMVPFATTIPASGMDPEHQPSLVLNFNATCVYLQCTVDSSTGFITAIQVEGDTGSGVPPSTSTQFNTLLSTIVIPTASSVLVNNDGAASNLFFKSCGALPLTDGTGYTIGT